MPVKRLSADYEKGLVDASMSALLELSVTLRKHKDSIVLVGGWAPYFLIQEFGREGFEHVGSIDIDLAVNPDNIDNDAYAGIIELIEDRGYEQRLSKDKQAVPSSYIKSLRSGSRAYDIQVDFLTSKDMSEKGHRHRRIQRDLRARTNEECVLAFEHNIKKRISGTLPGNGESDAEILMLDITGCLGMKGMALGDRYKEKDAYDIFAVIAHCLESPSAVAKIIKPFMKEPLMQKSMESIRTKFRSINAEGPSWVANFIQPTDPMAKQRLSAEAYVKVSEFLDALRS